KCTLARRTASSPCIPKRPRRVTIGDFRLRIADVIVGARFNKRGARGVIHPAPQMVATNFTFFFLDSVETESQYNSMSARGPYDVRGGVRHGFPSAVR